jgi:hypothetical protein
VKSRPNWSTFAPVICVSGECRSSFGVLPKPSQPTFASAFVRAEADVSSVHAAATAKRTMTVVTAGRLKFTT